MNAPVRVQTVEHLIRLQSRTMIVRVDGKEIETTPEHPFYVDGKGWTDAQELEVGDLLLGTDGQLTPVEDVRFTGETKPVYNMSITNDHTYFVGDVDWQFSVWVHNAYFDSNGIWRKNNGHFAAKPGPKAKKPASLHGNNLKTTRPAEGYSLRSRKTGKILKYGETIHGKGRYTKKYLDLIGAEMLFEAGGSKLQMHRWQTKKILEHIKEFGQRPPLNKTNY